MKIKSVKKIIIITGLALTLIWPQATILAADKLPIGSICTSNSDCKTNDCEGSQKKDASGSSLSFCDCFNNADCDTEYGAAATGKWECSDGADYTYDSDYCYNATTREVKTASGINKSASPIGKLTDAIFDSPAVQAALLEEVKTFKPGLEIRLPGLEFSDLANTVDEEGYLHIPWIGEFLKAIYNFGLVIISIVAVVMIIMQGAKIIVSGGESKVEGYKKIGQIVVGLFIAWGSYAILYTINPALVEFKSLKVKYIEREEIADYLTHPDIEDTYTPSSPEDTTPSGESYAIPGTNITIPLSKKDLCYLNTFGPTQAALNPKIVNVTLFGSKIKVHGLVAEDLQNKFNKLNASTDPSIVAWKNHLLDASLHLKPNKPKQGSASYDPINASGAFMSNGHGSDTVLIGQLGPQFGLKVSSGGLANTILAAYIKGKMADSGATTYKDKNGVERKFSKPKNFLSHGKHALGLSFDVDYPHNPFGTSTNIPPAAVTIMEEGGTWLWGMKFKDPGHFEYSGPLCK